MNAISFDIQARDGRARTGMLTTPHGTIHTPAFAPVGTKASVKGVAPEALKALGAEVVLANTYHLYLQPGEEIVSAAGGLAQFMGWQGPTMTDSGGYQVFSLGAAFGRKISKFVTQESPSQEVLGSATPQPDHLVHETPMVYDEDVASQHGQLAIIDDDGVSFTSHLDGSLHRFTPERSIEIQHALGADMFFAFDECTSPTEPYEYQREAMERTHRWAERSLKAHRQNIEASRTQAIFGIVQGGRHEDLRKESAREIAAMGFDGVGIGGSFSKEDMRGALQAAMGELPEELPKHFLGIGEPGDILEGIANGIDLFDCVAATRIGRHGSIYTRRGILHLTGERYKNDFGPLDAETSVPGLDRYTRAYVAHLIRAKEMLGSIICSEHNLGFILQLVAGARRAILYGRFTAYRDEFVRDYYHA
ncbi:tRNA guanosine(34) transglycosylase Tgt [Candidatus Kaiserbacteria bacterium CG10_big_fil_rev_8_21_14_0_10_56_12]|uniref:Queuine tRNA-ribosyltransferase n=1 Tax=Candidatus Kaiserbacteria bacterium CG10_big_fil_rev_8_21_14_0_10_56_12 TaxID=1974611 RepID=A0A2H0U980_9BACT|nr:MAG: tRNA guanosine(34) transglycosylase Tgt [Candidatus Kaiserbacteria bacterium CG10_big_fil_rev_8_21_14_0_10_56_12]